MNWKELHELSERIARLHPYEQLYLVGQIVGGIKHDHFTDHEADAKAMAEFAAEYTASEGWNAPYPLTDEELASIPNPQVTCQEVSCDAAKSIL